MGFLDSLFGKKKETAQPYQEVGVDLHSHLIPGIDDGAKTIADSIEMIRGLMDLGYRKMVTTPHIMSDAYPNTPEKIRAGLEKIKDAAAKEGLEVELEAAAEYYVDEAFVEQLETEELLSFGGEKKYLLFETSYISKPMSLNKVIFRLNTLGYSPVLAHPERYQYFWKDEGIEELEILRERGLKFQVNIASFAGRQGRRAANIARTLTKNGMVDFIGSDIHRPRQIETLRKAIGGSKELRNLVGSGDLLNHKL